MPQKAIANLDDLERIQRALKKTDEDIKDAIKGLKKEFANADWHDDRRRDFESKLQEATSAVGSASQRVSELEPILNKAIQELKTYLKR